jgi:hypothetical protein
MNRNSVAGDLDLECLDESLPSEEVRRKPFTISECE